MRKGIDVSYAQDGMDFEAAKAAGADFVIIRIARRGDSGTKYIDTSFMDNINKAIAAGMDVGVYFYTKAMSPDQAADDAEFCIEALKEYCAGTELKMGIWYDVEDNDTTGTCDNATITSIISRWICEMNNAGYKNAGLYAYYNWLTSKINVDELADYVPYWCAQYGYHENSFFAEHPDKNVVIWQYADNGTDNINVQLNDERGIYYDKNIFYEDGDDKTSKGDFE
jgi:lysozyme